MTRRELKEKWKRRCGPKGQKKIKVSKRQEKKDLYPLPMVVPEPVLPITTERLEEILSVLYSAVKKLRKFDEILVAESVMAIARSKVRQYEQCRVNS